MIKRHSVIRMSFFFRLILIFITVFKNHPLWDTPLWHVKLNHFENSSLKVMIGLSIKIFLSDDNEHHLRS